MRSTIAGAIALAFGNITYAGPSVTLSGGKVNGAVCSNTDQAAYFKGIPFAKPPIQDLRFEPPQAYTQQYPGGALDATKPPPACIQFGAEFREKTATSEDCLLLNVYAPVNANKDCKLPVRVWLYGGSNQDGGISDPLYDGCNVAKTDAIMVSINYRLGPLGFFSLKDAGFGGNQGIQDVLLGLQWVQDNIAAFGGDPKKVLLHGQSAGAIDSWTISTLPQAPKLFSAGIYESGGGRDQIYQSTLEKLSASYAQSLKCTTNAHACLQSQAVDALYSAYQKLPAINDRKFPAVSVDNLTSPSFSPCVDGKIIPKQPSVQGSRVPSIFGATSLEGTLFALGEFSKSGPANVTATDYAAFLHENFGSLDALIEKYYPVSAFQKTPFPAFYAIANVITDASYFCPARRGLEVTRFAGQPTWTYHFARNPKCNWVEGLPESAVKVLGAAHTVDIPFVLGNTVKLPDGNGTCNMSDQEVVLSNFLVKAWSSMADEQKPALASVWPAWTDAKSSLGINIVNVTTPGYVNYTQCALWDHIRDVAVEEAIGGR